MDADDRSRKKRIAERLYAIDQGRDATAGWAPDYQDQDSQSDLSEEEQEELRRGVECLELLELARQQGLKPLSTEQTQNDVTGSVASDHESSMVQLADLPEELPLTIDRYRIQRILGQGGFGVVYLAYDPALEREVALKIPRAEALASADARERFDRESKAAAMLGHPAIVPIYESGDPLKYIAYAYIPGISLADWLRLNTRVQDFRITARIVAALADGIQHAHSKGVLHRDLKPANILIKCESPGDESTSDESSDCPESQLPDSLFIADFGMAKIESLDATLTVTSAIIGTPAFMSPEQALSDVTSIGPATDIYALGAILYALITGGPPFQKESRLATVKAVCDELPKPMSNHRVGVPKDLEAIVFRCLEKSPRQRYESAEALRADLAAFCDGLPVCARAITAAERVYRSIKRAPLASGLIFACLLLLTGGIAFSSYFAWRANQNLGVAIENETKFKTEAKNAIAQSEAATEAKRLADLATAEANRRAESERTAKEQAEEQRRFADAVADFVIDDILELATLDGRRRFVSESPGTSALPPEPSLADLVVRAAEKLEARTDLEPRIEAKLRWIVGVSLRFQGNLSESIHHLEKSVELSKQVNGGESFEDILAMNSLAVAFRRQGKYQKSIQTLERCLEIADHSPGFEERLDTILAIQTNLANSHFMLGQYDRSIAILNDALATLASAANLDPEKEVYQSLYISLNLGHSYLKTKEFDKAIELLEYAYEGYLKRYGRNEKTMHAMASLAEAYRITGRLAEARQLFNDAWEWQTENLGPSDVATLSTLNNLASASADSGDLPEAIELAEKCLELRETRLGVSDLQTIETRSNLAAFYLWSKRPQKAIELYQTSLAFLENSENHELHVRTLRNLAECFRRGGKLEQGIAKARAALKSANATLSPTHLETINASQDLSRCLSEDDQWEAALPYIVAAHEGLTEKHGPDNSETVRAGANRGMVLFRLDRFEEAIPLLEKAFSNRKKVARFRSYGKWLRACYSKSGRAEQFAQVLEEHLAEARTFFKPKSFELAEFLSAAGSELLGLSEFQHAEEVLRESVEIRVEAAPAAWNTWATQVLLGISLNEQGKAKAAGEIITPAAKSMLQEFDKTEDDRLRPQQLYGLKMAISTLKEIADSEDDALASQRWAAVLKRLSQ